MKPYDQFVAENRRLTILLSLQDASGYRLNEFVIQPVVEQYGFQVSASLLRTDLSWLAEQQLIELDIVGDVYIATATRRGLDVASGRAVVPGVKRPQPEA